MSYETYRVKMWKITPNGLEPVNGSKNCLEIPFMADLSFGTCYISYLSQDFRYTASFWARIDVE